MNNSDKEPWGTDTPWKNKTAFFTYLRGCLRKAWTNNPVKIKVLQQSRKQIPNPNPKGNKKTVWGCTCSICGLEFPMKEIQVDHIVPAGKLNDISDVEGFVKRLLYITPDDLRVVCKGCNATLAYADRQGISLEEAFIDKHIIKMFKDKSDKEFFIERGLDVPSNSSKRRETIKSILMKEHSI